MSRGRNLHQVLSDVPGVLADCLSMIQPGDELLLVDRGVQWLARADVLAGGLGELNFQLGLNAIEADVSVRGLGYTTALAKLNLLTDSQWVEKVCQFDQVLSWK